MLRIVLILFGIGLAACATPETPEAANRSPAYEAGFGDGCATAGAESGPVGQPAKRDEMAFARDSGYRAGWISGHAACRMQDGPPRL